MFWSVCRKVMLFPALLHRTKVFFQFAASHPSFHLILLRTAFFLFLWPSDNGFASFWLGYAVFSIIFLRTASTVFKLISSSVFFAWRWFVLESTPNTVLACFSKVNQFSAQSFWEEPFLCFVTKLHFWCSLCRKHVLVCWQRNWLFWNHRKQGFSCLKHVALSFIARKTCFGLFAAKLRCFQRCYTGERFSSSLQWVTLRFASFYLKQRFYLIVDKLHCFRILFLRTTFSFVFVTKLHFWYSILPKKMFWFVGN